MLQIRIERRCGDVLAEGFVLNGSLTLIKKMDGNYVIHFFESGLHNFFPSNYREGKNLCNPDFRTIKYQTSTNVCTNVRTEFKPIGNIYVDSMT